MAESVHASRSTVIRNICGWNRHTSGRHLPSVYQRLETANPSRFICLKNIGIDETSYKKGHKL